MDMHFVSSCSIIPAFRLTSSARFSLNISCLLSNAHRLSPLLPFTALNLHKTFPHQPRQAHESMLTQNIHFNASNMGFCSALAMPNVKVIVKLGQPHFKKSNFSIFLHLCGTKSWLVFKSGSCCLRLHLPSRLQEIIFVFKWVTTGCDQSNCDLMSSTWKWWTLSKHPQFEEPKHLKLSKTLTMHDLCTISELWWIQVFSTILSLETLLYMLIILCNFEFISHFQFSPILLRLKLGPTFSFPHHWFMVYHNIYITIITTIM